MQEVFHKIEEIKNKVIILLNAYENLINENKILNEKIQSLEEELMISKEEQKNNINTVEKDKLKEELATYINEIDELIKILS